MGGFSSHTILRSNLGRRIMLLVGMSMLIMIVALVISGWLAVQQSSERISQERQALAQATARHLDYILQQNLSRLDSVQFAQGVDIEDDDLEPEKRALHNIYLSSIFDDGVFIADQQGKIIWAEPYNSALVYLNVSSYAPVSQALTTAKPSISNVLPVQPGGKNVFMMVAPLRNSAGRVVGLVGGQTDPTRPSLRAFTSPVALGETSHIDVIDGNGVVLASSDTQRILSAEPTDSIHREAEVTQSARLTAAPWMVAVKQSEQQALAPIRTMEQRFIIFGLSALVLAFFLSWGMARSLVRPIGELTAAARHISGGDLSQPIPHLGSDEIGQLSQSFDAMRVALGKSLEESRVLNQELESKVEERTRKLEESYQEIRRKEAARGELLRRVLTIQEEERKRIARELHDETTQSILALVMRLEAVKTNDDAQRAGNTLAEIKNLANRTLDSVHRIIFDLRPSLLDDLGLLSALRWLVDKRLGPLSVKTRVEVTGPERVLTPTVQIALFRVVQEAITNIARHANAHNVVVGVEFKDSSILIEVEDDGGGFDAAAISPADEARGVGLGLMGMKERVTLLGGRFEIESQPGNGTHLTIEVPLGKG